MNNTPVPLTIKIVHFVLWTNIQNIQYDRNRTESTAIVQKVQIVCDVRVKRTISKSLRVCTGF